MTSQCTFKSHVNKNMILVFLMTESSRLHVFFVKKLLTSPRMNLLRFFFFCFHVLGLISVTTCNLAIEALKLLREKKDGFDIVISDVNMPDMDGFKLLEHVGLEMDLPVISKLLKSIEENHLPNFCHIFLK